MVQGVIPEHLLAAVYDPMINLILQGSKSLTAGDRTLHYDPATYFVMSIELPAVGVVNPASTGEPYLAISLTLGATLLTTLLDDLPRPTGHCDREAHASSVTKAAFEVGYESATQFSGDYARVFGLPPARDTARMLGSNKVLDG